MKIHQNSWKFIKHRGNNFTKMTQNPSKFLKVHVKWLKFHEISWKKSSWNFMNYPSDCSCQFNIVNFDEYSWNFIKIHENWGNFGAFFHHISWIFMKFHEFFQLVRSIWASFYMLYETMFHALQVASDGL